MVNQQILEKVSYTWEASNEYIVVIYIETILAVMLTYRRY